MMKPKGRRRVTDKERLDYLSLTVRAGECLIVATGDEMVKVIAESKIGLRKAIDAAIRASREGK